MDEIRPSENTLLSTEKHDHHDLVDDQWMPGKNAPWIAAAELLIAALCTVLAIIVVVLSNGKRQGSWYIPATKHTKQLNIEPKLLLSVISSVTSLMLGLALKEGITVSWWHRALVGGKLRDLERHWSLGSSVLRAGLAGRYINHVAVGLLLVTATGIIESTLIQRSTTITAQPVKEATPFTMTSQLATELPYTGWMSTEARIVTNLVPDFAAVVRDFTSNTPINSSFIGCEGTCSALVPGAGLAADCQTFQTNLTIGPVAFNKTWPETAAMASNGSFPSQWNKQYTVFQTGFNLGADVDLNSGTYESILFDTASSTSVQSPNGDCPRLVTTKKCTLRPAIVNYPVTISNITVSLDKTALNGSPFYEVVKTLHLDDSGEYLNTRLGGIETALTNYYTSQGMLSWENQFGDGYILNLTGSLVYGYLGVGTPDASKFAYSCNATFYDPTTDLLSAFNDLMFRVAVNTSSTNDRAQVQAIPTGFVNYYQSSFLFLGIAVAIVWLNILVIVPMFWGWWKLGRKISLNPIEVAEAFDAPLLRKDTGHTDVDALIEQVGDRPVVFKPIEHVVRTDQEVKVVGHMGMAPP